MNLKFIPVILATLLFGRIAQAQNTFPSSGNVAIATGTAEETLDVNGTVQVKRVADATSGAPLKHSNVLQLQSSFWNGTASVNSNWKLWAAQYGAGGNESEFLLQQNDGITRFRVGTYGFGFYNKNSGPVMYYDQNSDWLNIPTSIHSVSINNGGYVGTYALTGNNWNTNKIYMDYNSVLTYVATGDYGTDLTAHHFSVMIPMTGANSNLALWDNGGVPLVIIKKDGRMGVGTATPNSNAKLDVAGNIFTSGKIAIGTTNMTSIGSYSLAVNGDAIFNKVKVKVYANWPDYVFDQDYKLPSLSEVENFIKQNKHLPGVVSAKEAETEGIDVQQTTATLLKKVEELTLYIIDLNKKVDQLVKENKELKAKP